jgi:hypothetical protein
MIQFRPFCRADVAQWQSGGIVNRRSWVRLPPSAHFHPFFPRERLRSSALRLLRLQNVRCEKKGWETVTHGKKHFFWSLNLKSPHFCGLLSSFEVSLLRFLHLGFSGGVVAFAGSGLGSRVALTFGDLGSGLAGVIFRTDGHLGDGEFLTNREVLIAL